MRLNLLFFIVLWVAAFAQTSALAEAVSALPAVVFPLEGEIGSRFGYRRHPLSGDTRVHAGVDIPAISGTRIRAIAKGTIVFAGSFGSYGKLVVVHHTKGITSHYGHCDSIEVSVGQRIQAGEILGTVGSSGKTTGPHLHFELRKDGNPGDPESYLPGLAIDPRG